MTRKEYKELRDELIEAHREYVKDVVDQMVELGMDELDYDGKNATLCLSNCHQLFRDGVNLSETDNVAQIINFARYVPDINSKLEHMRDDMAKSINNAIFFLQ